MTEERIRRLAVLALLACETDEDERDLAYLKGVHHALFNKEKLHESIEKLEAEYKIKMQVEDK